MYSITLKHGWEIQGLLFLKVPFNRSFPWSPFRNKYPPFNVYCRPSYRGHPFLYILDILEGLGWSYVMPDFAVFCCALQNYSKPYRSLPKFNSMNRYSIIVVAYQRYGLKRCSGMLGSILDLNVGSLHWSWSSKYCSTAHHHTNLKISHTTRVCIVTPIVSSKYWCLYQFRYVKVFSTN
jgi:hypothetical protein